MEYRFYTSTRVLELKYNLKVVAGNFIKSIWDPVVDESFVGLDRPFPDYITRALAQTNLPRDDCESTSSSCSSC